MSKPYYETTKVVKVVNKEKVVIRNPGIAGPKGDPGTQILTGPGLPSNIIGKVGDFYVNTNTQIMYIKTSNGWNLQNPVFEGFNRELLGQTYHIGVPTDTWEIVHNFGYNPNATCLDSSGSVIEGEISYPNENTIVLRFIGANTGTVILS
mgnify:FL=1